MTDIDEMDDQERDGLAAEYALGTLDAAERAAAEDMIASDARFAASVAAWENRLGALHDLVVPVEPPADLWPRIGAAAGILSPLASIKLPELPKAPDVAVHRDVASGQEPVAHNVVVLGTRLRRWRGMAAAASALAACLAIVLAVRELRPQPPPPPAPEPTIVVVEKPAPPAPVPPRLVAVLQRDASSPGFLLTVDVANRSFTLRKVGAQKPAGQAYELWLVSSRFPAPRSLGVIGDDDFTVRPALGGYDPDTINGATYAISIEPEGGSPTGAPTGPVVYTGTLIEALPEQK